MYTNHEGREVTAPTKKTKENKPKVMVIGPDSQVAKLFVDHGWAMCAGNEEPDLICFTGGEDVSPKLYDEPKHSTTYDNPRRDETEQKVFAKYEAFPKVGICRGGQFLNVLSGGSMYQNVNKHARGNHDMIDLITGESFSVTSTHHQMMRSGKDGEVLAIAFEATVFESGPGIPPSSPEFDTEVVWYRSTNSLCFQPHPEYPHSPEECITYFFSLIEYFWGLEGVK